MGLADVARYVIGRRRHLTQYTRVQNALDDVASIVYQALTCRVLRLSLDPRVASQTPSNDVASSVYRALT
jgi:hypothetical protein